jgi:chemotaxis protein MotA
VDLASLLGLLLAVAGIIIGHTLDGGKFSSLVQPAAFAIVVVGTLGAVLLQTRRKSFIRGLRMLAWVFKTPPDRRQQLAREIHLWSLSARRDGLLSLEQHMLDTPDKFIQKGLRLMIDGINPDKLRGLLDTEVTAYEFGQRQAVKIWESAAGYSPTIGILGAVLGLIHVMENLSDPSKLGAGIAVAFVSTVYGVGLANLFFYPVANKLKGIVAETVTQYEILTEVFYDIASGDHSRVIDERVASLLSRP